MDYIFKFTGSVAGFFSPAPKRRRTTGPLTPAKDQEAMFDAPATEPQGSKAQATIIARVTKKYVSNPRKRRFQDEEVETIVTLKPEDSVSQIGALEESDVDDGEAEEEDVEEGSGITEEGSDAEVEQSSEIVDEEAVEEDDLGSGEEEVETDLESSSVVDEDGGSGEEDVEADLESSSVVEKGSDADVENSDVDDEEGSVISVYDEEPELDEAELAAKEIADTEARVQEYLQRQAELALAREDVEKIKALGHWHPDAMILYEKIKLRSFEQVLPDDFKIDFPTLPVDIFAPDGVKTFVNTNCLTTLNGVKALQNLLQLGLRARERKEATGSAEKLIAKGINSYIRWSERDGGFDKLRFLPVLVVLAAKPNQPTAGSSAALEQQLKFLAKSHREYLTLPTNEAGGVPAYRRQPPLLYGLMVVDLIIVVFTLDSADPEEKFTMLDHFQFKDAADIWQGLGIAFVVIMARNYVMAVKDEFEEESEETDPDL